MGILGNIFFLRQWLSYYSQLFSGFKAKLNNLLAV